MLDISLYYNTFDCRIMVLPNFLCEMQFQVLLIPAGKVGSFCL
jgi:hypothetical protein